MWNFFLPFPYYFPHLYNKFHFLFVLYFSGCCTMRRKRRNSFNSSTLRLILFRRISTSKGSKYEKFKETNLGPSVTIFLKDSTHNSMRSLIEYFLKFLARNASKSSQNQLWFICEPVTWGQNLPGPSKMANDDPMPYRNLFPCFAKFLLQGLSEGKYLSNVWVTNFMQKIISKATVRVSSRFELMGRPERFSQDVTRACESIKSLYDQSASAIIWLISLCEHHTIEDVQETTINIQIGRPRKTPYKRPPFGGTF